MRTPILKRLPLGTAALCVAASALPQTMKPGLWEWQSTMKSQSGEMEAAMAEMQKHMASMPPDPYLSRSELAAQPAVKPTLPPPWWRSTCRSAAQSWPH